MSAPILFDTNALWTLEVTGLLTLLPKICDGMLEPRWSEVVFYEVDRHSKNVTACMNVKNFSWLGEPKGSDNHGLIYEIRRRMAGSTASNTKNLGESESIAIAKDLGGKFVTDDRDAFQISSLYQYTGLANTYNTCSLLNYGMGFGFIDINTIELFHKEAYSNGRKLICGCDFDSKYKQI